MAWERLIYDDSGAYFRGRIKRLRPTLHELYLKTRAYNDEHEELARRMMHSADSLSHENEGDADARREYEELVEDGLALLDAANAYGQAFVMVVNPALQELKDNVKDVFGLGPIVHGEIRLGCALIEVANAVRHRHKAGKLSPRALPLSAGRNTRFTGILTSLGLNAKNLDAAKTFIVMWGPPTYRELKTCFSKSAPTHRRSFLTCEDVGPIADVDRPLSEAASTTE